MLKKHIVLFVIILCLTQLYSQNQANVTYLANEGFMIEAQGKKILVDALFNDKTIYYADVPSDSLLENIISGKVPFNNIDLLLVTHQHRDHFSSIPVGEFLLKNSQTKLVCNKQTADKLKEEFKKYNDISDQVIVLSPELDKNENEVINDINICAFGFNHSPYFIDDSEGNKVDRHKDIEVNGYLVKAGDFSFLHCGDSYLHQHTEQHVKISKENDSLDLLFLFAPAEETITIVNEYLLPKEIIMMHLPAERETVYNQYGMINQLWSNAHLMTEPMEKLEIKY